MSTETTNAIKFKLKNPPLLEEYGVGTLGVESIIYDEMKIQKGVSLNNWIYNETESRETIRSFTATIKTQLIWRQTRQPEKTNSEKVTYKVNRYYKTELTKLEGFRALLQASVTVGASGALFSGEATISGEVETNITNEKTWVAGGSVDEEVTVAPNTAYASWESVRQVRITDIETGSVGGYGNPRIEWAKSPNYPTNSVLCVFEEKEYLFEINLSTWDDSCPEDKLPK